MALPVPPPAPIHVRYPRYRPNYWLGFVLNLFVPGSGLLIAGEFTLWFAWWLAGGSFLLFLYLVGFGTYGATLLSQPVEVLDRFRVEPWLALFLMVAPPLVLWLGTFFHYRDVYAAKYGTARNPIP